MKTIYTLALFAAFAFTLSSCGHKQKETTGLNPDRIPVKVQSIEKGLSTAPIVVSGQFTTDDEVVLSFKTGGVINQILVKEGDAVQQGQVLATLVLTEIDAQAQQAQLGVEKAQRDYNRVLNLYKDSVATLEQVQNAKTGLDLARQQLSAAQFNKGYSIIRAPKSGFVLKKMANVGQVVGAGTPVLQTNGAHTANWVLRVGLNDADWAAIKAGDKATVSMESVSGAQIEGIVSRKSEGVDAATGSFSADIKLTGKPQAIAAGMFGKAVITPSQTNNVATAGWTVPYDAILDGDGSTGFVFVTSDDKVAHKVKVSVASMDKNGVTITGGLERAGKLIVSGSAYLADNSPIKIIK
jgi:RND family efflux transporter MFP subunit